MRTHQQLSRRILAALALGVTLAILGSAWLIPSAARARTVRFENGASAELEGRELRGTAHVELVPETLIGNEEHAQFWVTMPDGQVLEGHCLDHDNWAPADGDYPFVATYYAAGAYDVVVRSDEATAYHPAHDEWALRVPGLSFSWPAQRIGQLSWVPRLRPEPVGIAVGKVDAETGHAQGSGTLTGALLELSYYPNTYADPSALPDAPQRRWVLRTVDDGAGHAVADLSNDACWVEGDERYLDASDNATVPPGTVAVRELEAPEGYEASGEGTWLLHVTSEGALEPCGTWPASADWLGSPGVALSDRVKRGGIRLLKQDAETADGRAQGDAGLGGVRFEVVNRSEGAVLVGGQLAAPGEVVGGVELVTDAAGYAATEADALPLGTYEVREVAGNDGYRAGSETRTVTVDEPRELADAGTFSDEVRRGGVRATKVDAETGLASALGGATLGGCELELVNESAAPVVVGGETFGVGAVCARLVTDEAGVAQTDAQALPVGTYELREAHAPAGYRENGAWRARFEVREEGAVVDLGASGSPLPDQALRCDLAFTKRAAEDGTPLAGVAFLVESLSSGEAHVLVSDPSGRVDSSAAHASHALATNANDRALRADGGVDEDTLSASAGTWFAGRANATDATPSDALGGLPYDRYRITELRCAGNLGRALTSWTCDLHADGELVDQGFVDDAPLRIGTELVAQDGSHHVSTEGPVTLTDHVSYEGLVPGATYVLRGELRVLGEGGDALAAEPGAKEQLARELSFVPKEASGQIDVTFSVDASLRLGSSLVAFERLYEEGASAPAACHEDASDAAQTVRIDPRDVPTWEGGQDEGRDPEPVPETKPAGEPGQPGQAEPTTDPATPEGAEQPTSPAEPQTAAHPLASTGGTAPASGTAATRELPRTGTASLGIPLAALGLAILALSLWRARGGRTEGR